MTGAPLNKNPNLGSAVLLSPLAIIPAMLLAISILRFVYPDAQAALFRQYHGGLVMSLFGLVIAYGFTLLYGLPVYWLLNKFHRYNVFTIIVASLIPALLLSIINNEQWQYYLAMAYFSVCVAITFWAVSVRKQKTT